MTSDQPAFRCSDAARERQDPMLGTAPPQGRFLLVEQDSGWAYDGFPSIPMPEDVRAEVLRRAERVGARVMLIRRPGRPSSSVCSLRSWCVVDGGAAEGHRVTWGTWAYPAELLSGVDRLEQLARWSLEGTDVAAAGVPGDDEPLLLVCTHGKKDVCCAVRGRPVAAALAARWPEQTWECSHTGGDRFAANLLLLPDGATYGGLDVEAADQVVRAHREGRPVTAYLRGVVGRPRPVQAAVVAVHEQMGPLPWRDVVPTGALPIEPTEDEVAATLVRMELRDGRVVEVEVREHVRAAARLTCQGGVPKVSQVPVPGTVRVVAGV
jgi:hypothetical protein